MSSIKSLVLVSISAISLAISTPALAGRRPVVCNKVLGVTTSCKVVPSSVVPSAAPKKPQQGRPRTMKANPADCRGLMNGTPVGGPNSQVCQLPN